MKLLWLSDGPTTPSGFGNVTRFVCDGLSRLGHDVHILGWQNTGEVRTWNSTHLLGTGWHPMGADVLLSHLYRVRPDYLITLADVWWMSFLTEPALAQYFRMSGTRWASYFPIDGHRLDGTLPPSWIEILRHADVRIAMARYGQITAARLGVPCDYIPHGVDTSVFRPADDPLDAKRGLGYQGRFVILSDARNQPRKLLHRLLRLFTRFAEGKPDALLHLHCDPSDAATREDRYSYRIDEDVRALGLGEKVRFTRDFSIKRGLPLDELVRIYQAADVHVLASAGEGFGLPTLQAAACGVVPVAPDYSANPELIEGHGAMIRVAEYFPDEFGIGRAFLDLNDGVAKLDALYADREALSRMSRAARAFAEPYDWARLIPAWDALLHTRLEAKEPRRLVPTPRTETYRVTSSSDAALNPTRSIAGIAPRTFSTAPTPQRSVRGRFGVPIGGIEITFQVAEMHAGAIAGHVSEDARAESGSPRLAVPIQRTERDTPGRPARGRDTGLVYLAGAPLDEGSPGAALFASLRAIFPGLRPWSRYALPAPETYVRGESVSLGPPMSFERALSRSILAIALDAEADDEELPIRCAQLGVPLIAPARNRQQVLLWPSLAIDLDDPTRFVEFMVRARHVLADQVEVADLTGAASAALERLASAGCLNVLSRDGTHAVTRPGSDLSLAT